MIVLSILCWLYFLGVCALEYYAFFALGDSWKLALLSKILLVLLGIGGFIFFISGIGLLMKKEWARRLLIGVGWVHVAYSIYAMVVFMRSGGGKIDEYVYGLITIVFYALFVFIPALPNVRKSFTR